MTALRCSGPRIPSVRAFTASSPALVMRASPTLPISPALSRKLDVVEHADDVDVEKVGVGGERPPLGEVQPLAGDQRGSMIGMMSSSERSLISPGANCVSVGIPTPRTFFSTTRSAARSRRTPPSRRRDVCRHPRCPQRPPRAATRTMRLALLFRLGRPVDDRRGVVRRLRGRVHHRDTDPLLAVGRHRPRRAP